MRALSSVRSQQELGEIATLKDSAHNKNPKPCVRLKALISLDYFIGS